MLRAFWAYLNGVIATIVMSTMAIVASVFGHRGLFYDWVARTWARWIMAVSGVRVSVEGAEHIHGNTAQIIASNHQSWFDVFALAANIPKRYRFIAKEELRRIPIFGRAWESAGHISVNRQDRSKAITALDAAAALVRSDNSSIVIFPEGTRSRDGNLLPFKKGAFMLALQTGLEIVPAAVIGSRAIQKKGEWRVHSGPVILRFGEPIDSSQYDETRRDELMQLVRDRIAAMLNHPLREKDL